MLRRYEKEQNIYKFARCIHNMIVSEWVRFRASATCGSVSSAVAAGRRAVAPARYVYEPTLTLSDPACTRAPLLCLCSISMKTNPTSFAHIWHIWTSEWQYHYHNHFFLFFSKLSWNYKILLLSIIKWKLCTSETNGTNKTLWSKCNYFLFCECECSLLHSIPCWDFPV